MRGWVPRHSQLRLNSIGDAACRSEHRTALIAYLKQRQTELSDDSLRRCGGVHDHHGPLPGQVAAPVWQRGSSPPHLVRPCVCVGGAGGRGGGVPVWSAVVHCGCSIRRIRATAPSQRMRRAWNIFCGPPAAHGLTTCSQRCARWAFPSCSTRRWCEALITTARRCLSLCQPAITLARRRPSLLGGGMTTSWPRWAAGPPRRLGKPFAMACSDARRPVPVLKRPP